MNSLKMIKRYVSIVLCCCLLTGEAAAPAFASEIKGNTEEAAAGGIGEVEITPDFKGASMKVIDENGREIPESDPGYREALKTYDRYFSQLNGKTFDAGDIDMTGFVLDQLGEGDGESSDSDEIESPNEDTGNLSSVTYGEVNELKYTDLKKPVRENGVTTWDCLWFGNYDTGRNKDVLGAVKWRVLDINDGKALLISDETLYNTKFAFSPRNPSYRDSFIRKSVKDFLTPRIITGENLQAVIKNDDGDAVRIPSLSILNEEKYGFDGNDSIKTSRAFWISDVEDGKIQYIDESGDVKTSGSDSFAFFSMIKGDWENRGVRPVIELDLSLAEGVQYAGTVRSDGKSDMVKPAGVRTIDLIPGENATVNKKKGSISFSIMNDRVNELPDALWDETDSSGGRKKDFVGWFDSESGGRKYVSGSVLPSDVNKLYARFERALSAEEDFKVEGPKLKVSLPRDGVPFLSEDLSFDFAGFSTSLVYDREEGTYEVGIGFDIAAIKSNVKDRGADPKKYFGGEISEMIENLAKAEKAFGDAMFKAPKPMSMGGETEPSFTIMGYASGTYDEETGLSAPTLGRVCIGFGIYYDGQWQTAIVFVPIAIRLKFGAEGTVALEIEKNDDDYSYKGTAEFILPGIELRAGVGLAKVASIGVYGAAQSIIAMELTGTEFSGNWKLNGEAGGYVTVLWWDYKKCFIKGEVRITDWKVNWDDEKGDSVNGTSANEGEYTEDFSKNGSYGTTRSYENVLDEWNGGNAGNISVDPDGRTELLHDMSDMADPKAVQTVDGKAVIAFTAANDEEEAEKGNYTSVYYGVYDLKSGDMSTISFNHIDADHKSAEFSPSLATDGTDIWAVWMDASKEVTPAQNEVLKSIQGEELTKEQKKVLGELEKCVEIRAAKFNKDTLVFEESVLLDKNNAVDSSPVIAAVGEELHVVWLSDNTPVAGVDEIDKGKEVIKHVSKSKADADWSEAETIETGGSISGLAVGELQGEAVLAYCLDTDRDFQTTEDVELHAEGLSGGSDLLLSGEKTNPVNPQFARFGDSSTPALLWGEMSADKPCIRYAESLSGETKRIHFDDPSALSPDFTALDSAAAGGNDDRVSVIITKTGDNDIYGESGAYKESGRKINVYFIDDIDDQYEYEEDEGYDAGYPMEISNTGLNGDVDKVTGFWDRGNFGMDDEIDDLFLIYTEGDASGYDDKTFELSTSLYISSIFEGLDIMFNEEDSEVDVDPWDISIGEEGLNLSFLVKNSSFEDLSEFRSVVRDQDNNVLFNDIVNTDGNLEPGDSVSCNVALHVNEDSFSKGEKLTMHIIHPDSPNYNLSDDDAANGVDLDDEDVNNYMAFNVGDVELSLDQSVSADDRDMEIKYSVTNESILDTKAKLSLYLRDKDGDEKLLYDEEGVTSEEIFEIGAGETKEFILDKDIFDSLTSSGDVISAKLTNLNNSGSEAVMEEAYTGDNEDLLKVNHTCIEKVITDTDTLFLFPGESKSVSARVEPEKLSDIGVYWVSSDESVATVDKDGKITGIFEGTATVTAIANDGGGAKSEIKVTVGTGGLAALGDTHALSPVSGSKKKYVLDLPEDVTEAVITVARGNRFSILNGVKGSFKLLNRKTDRKYLSVSKKGAVRIKKETPKEGSVITFTDSRSAKTVKVTVRVREQRFEGKKKLSTSVSGKNSFDLKAELLLNAEFKPDNERYKKVIPDFKVERNRKTEWHVTGKPAKTGYVKVPVYVYGRKFKMKIRVK